MLISTAASSRATFQLAITRLLPGYARDWSVYCLSRSRACVLQRFARRSSCYKDTKHEALRTLYCIVTPGHSHHLRRTGPAYEKRTLPRPPHPTHPPHPSQPSPRLRPACTDRVSPPPSRCRRASRAEGVRTRGLSVRRRRVRDTTATPECSSPLERSPSSSLLLRLPPGAERMCVGSWRCGWRCGSPRSWRPSARASRGVGRTACGWPW